MSKNKKKDQKTKTEKKVKKPIKKTKLTRKTDESKQTKQKKQPKQLKPIPKADRKQQIQKPVKTRTKRYLILAFILAAFTALMFAWAIYDPDSLFVFYIDLSKAMLSGLAAISSMVPFAIWEWGVVVLTLWFFISLVLDIHKKKFWQWLSGVLLGVVTFVFLFTNLWGLNHFGPKIDTKMDIQPKQTTVAELREAAEYYRDRASELSTQVPRDDTGWFNPGELSAQSEIAAESFDAMAAENDWFSGSTAGIKPLLSSWVFGKIGITGIFIDFTGESCVSTKTYVCSQPFTVCHEMSHRLCFAAENEANFVAYLACERSRSMLLQYSGYYQAYVYCYNALYAADSTAATEVWRGASPELQQDCINAKEHHEEVGSETATKIVEAVNDTYLKAYSENSGTRSYGEVTDLLVAWYQKNYR